MYYINNEHKENFCEMVGKFPRAMKGDRHMQLACYISAIPNIYSQIKGHIVGHHPFNWFVAYKNGKTNIELDHQLQQIVIAGLDYTWLELERMVKIPLICTLPLVQCGLTSCIVHSNRL